MTSAAAAIVRRASAAGYSVNEQPGPRGTIEVIIDQHGLEGHFGAIIIGARTGRIIRANLARMINGCLVERKVVGAHAARALIIGGVS